jgi:hypothetical protein
MSQEADKRSASNPSTPKKADDTTPEVSATSYSPTVDDSYGYNDDPYAYENNTGSTGASGIAPGTAATSAAAD